MSDVQTMAVEAPVQSPPPAPTTPREPADEPRARLHQLAGELMRVHNRRLLVEFLSLRRTIR